MKDTNVTESHKKIVELLKSNGINDFHGGIQLFANQYDKAWAISVNFNGTKLYISRDEIDNEELVDDELITLYRSWFFKE